MAESPFKKFAGGGIETKLPEGINLDTLLASVAKMDRREREELLLQIEEYKRRESRKKLFKYYPEEGKLSRHNYPKHMAFFKAGKEHRERLMMAANRIGKCTTAETLIDTPGGKVRMGDLYQNGRKFRVYAWDGEKIVEADALPPFKKGSEPCVRVSLSSGAWVDTALGHRVLTNRGWNTISDCLPGISKQSFYSFQGPSSALSPPSPITLSHSPTISYKPIGRNDVYDFEVPVYHNYIAGDMIHHNSEGVGGYEVTLHLLGWYPDWWEGHRFNKAVNVWAVGETGKEVRQTIQKKLLGEYGDFGTGLIPYDYLGKTTTKQGVPNAIDQVTVKHRTSRNSILTFKSYEEGRKSFEGDEVDVVWCDEEPPLDVYTECVIRTMTNNGLVLLTFTPLLGMSEVVRIFMKETGTII